VEEPTNPERVIGAERTVMWKQLFLMYDSEVRLTNLCAAYYVCDDDILLFGMMIPESDIWVAIYRWLG